MEKSPYSRCSRCGGNMVHESFFSLVEQFTGLKCVICGDVIDPVILQNRQLMKAGHVMILPKERGAASKHIHA
ncbi:MAG: hypothetical protein Q8K00_14215 [Syntrophales bacterium]|nr:hypothetical protein [Syntrophales bacterium]